MENKHVGWLIVGIAVAIALIVWIFNTALNDIVGATCTHGPTCSMFETIKVQTWLSLSIVAVVFIIGLVIMFSKPKEKIILQKIKQRAVKKKLNLEGLDKDEKQIIELLQKENGGMFQADLMEKLEAGKVKITRLLDKLEAKQLIERKRRGMNNIVVLKS